MDEEPESIQGEENLNLVVFSEEFYPSTSGGAHTRWLFSKKAVQRGVDVTSFTFREPGTPRTETVDGVRIHRPVPSSPFFLPPYSNFSIPLRIILSMFVFLYAVWWFYRHDVDAIHSASYPFHWTAKLLGSIYNVPVTNFIAYTPSLERGVPLRRAFEWVNFRLLMGDTVFCQNPRVKDAVQSVRNVDVRIIHGILHAEKFDTLVDSDESQFTVEFPNNSILIAFVGRLVPIKRPEIAVQTIADLPAEFHLVIVGDGPKMQDLVQQVETNNLRSRVTFTGELPHDEVLSILKYSDILQLTSRTESHPAVVFEALAAGSHVVAPPIGVLPSMDDDHLHVASVENHGHVIRNVGHGSRRVRKNIVREYSMDRYTTDILDRTVELCRP